MHQGIMLSTAGSLILGGNLILSEKVMVQSASPPLFMGGEPIESLGVLFLH